MRFTHNVVVAVMSRVERAPPRRESLPLGGKVARYAPDEGKMSGGRNKPTRIIAIPANFPLISHLR